MEQHPEDPRWGDGANWRVALAEMKGGECDGERRIALEVITSKDDHATVCMTFDPKAARTLARQLLEAADKFEAMKEASLS